MAKKKENEIQELNDWDYEHAETREPVRSPRVIVSVAFRRADFQKIAEYAERIGKRTSGFIREAALEKAVGQDPAVTLQGFGSAGTLWFGDQLPSVTRVSGQAIESGMGAVAVTSS